MLWRQGDIFIETVGGVPVGAVRKPEPVLAEGELTWHFHRAEDARAAAVYEHRGNLFLDVTADSVRVVHDEHGPILLSRGTYRVWRQREFTPALLPAERAMTSARDARFVED